MRRLSRYIKASSKAERGYHSVGMPVRYWADLHYKFSTVIIESEYKTTYYEAAQQHDKWNAILEDHNRIGVIGIGSIPSDDTAMAAASDLAKRMVKARKHVQYIDLGDEMIRSIKRSILPDLVVIHNVMKESTAGRIMAARDWILWADGTLCLMVIAGSDPLSFFNEKIHLRLSLGLYSQNPPYFRRAT